MNQHLAIEIAERIKKHLSAPIDIFGYEFSVTSSIGISIFPFDGKSIEELVKNADQAMYESKKLGKNQVIFFGKEEIKR